MNTICFGLKRAYYASLLGSRALTKRFSGLTPARFDALYLLRDDGLKTQSSMWHSLGVSRATISKMLHSLEALGWIQRSRGYPDTRQRVVWLTQKGKQLLQRAIRTILGSGISDLMMGSMSTDQNYSPSAMDAAIFAFETHLVSVQKTFRHHQLSLYPWAPYDPFENL